ncbi:MAG: PAS domain-containing protein [Flavobacteriaceae bacterium]|nr:PAS domain-containing protein [Flavobacteriaceae bacterium]
MEEFKKPTTVNLEIILSPNQEIMSKTNKNGLLEFVNDYFVEISGYEEYELMGKPIYCTQHPDMPEAIFKMMWEKLLKKENFPVLIKNLAKNGKYYWAVSDFAFKVDEDSEEILAIYNRRKKASRESIQFFDKLYKKLKNIEAESGILLSEKYLNGHLEEIGKTFAELLEQYNKNFKPEKVIKPVVTTTITPTTITPTTITPTTITPTTITPIASVGNVTSTNALISKTIKTPESVAIKKNKQIQKTEIIPDKKIPEKTVSKKETTTSKKSFFQKMFGKSEKELEEERKREK